MKYQRFVRVLFEPFDEHGEADDLREFAGRCEDARAAFLAGDPLEDPELSSAANQLFREQGHDTKFVLGLDCGLADLKGYVEATADARILRLHGRIADALVRERTAQTHYDKLPAELRW